jgi:hypothetical protein
LVLDSTPANLDYRGRVAESGVAASRSVGCELATGPEPGTPGSVNWSCASPGCGRAATSRASWSRAGGLSRPWSRWSRRGLCQWGQHAAGGPAGRAARHRRHVHGPGVAVVPGLDEQVRAFRERPPRGQGLDVGEAEAFWRELLRGVRARGLVGGASVCLRCPPGAQDRDRHRPWTAHGNAAPGTSCATCSATSPRPSSR